jgi:cytidylate kinase
MNPVVAIDGPAASGKSTVARIVARELGWVYVDTGAMYRAVTWQVLRRHIPVQDAERVAAYLMNMPFTCEIADGATRLTCEEPIAAEALRQPEVAASVSAVAAIPDVRHRLVAVQRGLRDQSPLVMEGRDIGSVVFPSTSYKFYLDAAPEVRAARRADQGETDAVVHRDRLDSQRAVAPLQIALGAEVIDTARLGPEAVAAQILGRVRAGEAGGIVAM